MADTRQTDEDEGFSNDLNQNASPQLSESRGLESVYIIVRTGGGASCRSGAYHACKFEASIHDKSHLSEHFSH